MSDLGGIGPPDEGERADEPIRVFLSYNSEDAEEIRRICQVLEGTLDPRVHWFVDAETLAAGPTEQVLTEAIAESDLVVVFVGRHGFGETHYLEFKYAIDVDKGRVVGVKLPGYRSDALVVHNQALRLTNFETTWTAHWSREETLGWAEAEAIVKRVNEVAVDKGPKSRSPQPAALALAGAVPAAAPPARNRAMLVAFDDYKNRERLASRADRERIRKLLEHWEIEDDPPAVHDQFGTAVYRFFTEAAPDDTLLFYFSGHGAQRPGAKGQFHLCLPGSEKEGQFKENYPFADLAAAVNQSPASRIVLIFDCCEVTETVQLEPGRAAMFWGDGINSATGSHFTSRLLDAVRNLLGANLEITTGLIRERLGQTGAAVMGNEHFRGDIALQLSAPGTDDPAPAAVAASAVAHLRIGLADGMLTATLSGPDWAGGATDPDLRRLDPSSPWPRLIDCLQGVIDAARATDQPEVCEEAARLAQVEVAQILREAVVGQTRWQQMLDQDEPLHLQLEFDRAVKDLRFLPWEQLTLDQSARPTKVLVERVQRGRVVTPKGPLTAPERNAVAGPSNPGTGRKLRAMLISSLDPGDQVRQLHPLSAVARENLRLAGYLHTDAPPTPVDRYGFIRSLAVEPDLFVFQVLLRRGHQTMIRLPDGQDLDGRVITSKLQESQAGPRHYRCVIVETLAPEEGALHRFLEQLATEVDADVAGLCYPPAYARQLRPGHKTFATEVASGLTPTGGNFAEAVAEAREQLEIDASAQGLPAVALVGQPVVYVRAEREGAPR